jgi:hypothetical protein
MTSEEEQKPTENSEKIPETDETPQVETPVELPQEDRRPATFQSIIKEIIDTERDYVNDLQTLNEVKKRVFYSNLKLYYTTLLKMVSPQELQPIFSNINDIFNINKLLLKELQEMTDTSRIGEIFLRYSDFLKIYTNYCSNQVCLLTV